MKHVLLCLVLVLVVMTACTPEATPSTVVEEKVATIVVFNPFPNNILFEYKQGLREQLEQLGHTNVRYIDVPTPENLSPPALLAVYAPVITDNTPDLVLCVTTAACTFAKNNTPETIAIVFTAVTDPIAAGLVQDFTGDNGNITGVASAARNASNDGRAFAWLMEMNPNIRKVFIPHNPQERAAAVRVAVGKEAAESFNVEVVMFTLESAEDLPKVVENIPDDADAIITYSESLFSVDFMRSLSAAAVERGIIHLSFSVQYGQLAAYAPDNVAIGRQAGVLASRILNGTAVSDLPVETPEFNLYINVSVADATGIELSEQILRQAVVIRDDE